MVAAIGRGVPPDILGCALFSLVPAGLSACMTEALASFKTWSSSLSFRGAGACSADGLNTLDTGLWTGILLTTSVLADGFMSCTLRGSGCGSVGGFKF
jgi:hypothetical protein